MQRTVTCGKWPTDHSVVTEGDHAGIKILQIQPSVPLSCPGAAALQAKGIKKLGFLSSLLVST